MSTVNEKKILDELDLSGFSLEIDVLNCLIKNGWFVYPQYVYVDEQTNKLRTVDIVASPYGLIFDKFAKVIIECKSSKKKPWVFFAPVSDKKSVLHTPLGEPFLGAALQMTFSIGKQQGLLKKKKDVEMIPIEVATRFEKSHFFNSGAPLAFSYHIVGKKSSEDSIDDLREGIYQINGALHSRYFPRNNVVFLALVFGGEMYSIDTNKRLLPINHVIFFNSMYHDENSPYTPALIDIVRADYFEKYLDILKNDAEILVPEKKPASA